MSQKIPETPLEVNAKNATPKREEHIGKPTKQKHPHIGKPTEQKRLRTTNLRMGKEACTIRLTKKRHAQTAKHMGKPTEQREARTTKYMGKHTLKKAGHIPATAAPVNIIMEVPIPLRMCKSNTKISAASAITATSKLDRLTT
jgi:hypothetical protein